MNKPLRLSKHLRLSKPLRLSRIEQQASTRSVGKPCACQSALSIVRRYLAFPTVEAVLSAPVCPYCGRSSFQSAEGYPLKLYVGMDAEAF